MMEAALCAAHLHLFFKSEKNNLLCDTSMIIIFIVLALNKKKMHWELTEVTFIIKKAV